MKRPILRPVERPGHTFPHIRAARTLQVLILSAGLVVSACGGGAPGPPDESPEARAVRGRLVYQTHCTACHDADPAKPGPRGPAVRGSSRELIEARVLRAEYPPGYTPKSDSSLMPALPHLAGAIDDLAAYLD
jgi:mono/diheme cytochrome c family protein